MKKIMPVAALSLVLPLTLAACGSSGTSTGSGGAGSKDSSTVTIGYQNNGSVDPAQAALSLGLYQKYITGKVKLVYFASGPASLTALGSGDIDIMTGIGNPPVASALANQVPISVIWAEELGQSDQQLVVKKNSGITSVAGLKGKQVATVVGSTSAYALAATLKKNGLSESDIQTRNMDPQTLQTAWTKGQVSAAYIWYPVLGKILAQGGTSLANDGDVSSTAPIYNFSVVNKTWAAHNPGIVKDFIKAQDAGVKALRKDPQAALAAMIKDTHETMAEAKVAWKSTKSFDAAQQLDPDALGKSNNNSLAATSLLASSKYLHSINPGTNLLTPGKVPIDRSYVQAYLTGEGKSR